jgi:hypothetical protein
MRAALTSGVVTDDVADQQRVGQAVRHVVGASQLVCHGVAHTQEGVGKSHACKQQMKQSCSALYHTPKHRAHQAGEHQK